MKRRLVKPALGAALSLFVFVPAAYAQDTTADPAAPTTVDDSASSGTGLPDDSSTVSSDDGTTDASGTDTSSLDASAVVDIASAVAAPLPPRLQLMANGFPKIHGVGLGMNGYPLLEGFTFAKDGKPVSLTDGKLRLDFDANGMPLFTYDANGAPLVPWVRFDRNGEAHYDGIGVWVKRKDDKWVLCSPGLIIALGHLPEGIVQLGKPRTKQAIQKELNDALAKIRADESSKKKDISEREALVKLLGTTSPDAVATLTSAIAADETALKKDADKATAERAEAKFQAARARVAKVVETALGLVKKPAPKHAPAKKTTAGTKKPTRRPVLTVTGGVAAPAPNPKPKPTTKKTTKKTK